jgi:hypothetical protein
VSFNDRSKAAVDSVRAGLVKHHSPNGIMKCRLTYLLIVTGIAQILCFWLHFELNKSGNKSLAHPTP